MIFYQGCRLFHTATAVPEKQIGSLRSASSSYDEPIIRFSPQGLKLLQITYKRKNAVPAQDACDRMIPGNQNLIDAILIHLLQSLP